MSDLLADYIREREAAIQIKNLFGPCSGGSASKPGRLSRASGASGFIGLRVLRRGLPRGSERRHAQAQRVDIHAYQPASDPSFV
jgi:hypothetical protein